MSLPFLWYWEHFLQIAEFLLTIVFVSFILRSKKPPGSTWAWLLFIILIPYLGIPLYIFFSGRKYPTKIYSKGTLFPIKMPRSNQTTLARILEAMGEPPSRVNSEARLVSSGAEALETILALIDSAKNTIHLSSFIFSRDEVALEILVHLKQKADAGIRVRILLDSFGAAWVRHPDFKAFVSVGGEIGYFMPFFSFPFRGRSNLRNHRKILIIDSAAALVGGMNIANEYMGSTENSKHWIDLGIKLTGASAFDLEMIFCQDWKYATRKEIKLPIRKSEQGETLLQVVASGPDLVGDCLYDSLMTLIFQAKKKIWVASPYFIPDEALAKALQLAAQRGIEVKILIPKKSNHFLADFARGSYLRQLIAAKCQIHFFPQMLHAKAFLVDEEYALIGSANFDMRSLLYNYEAGIFLMSETEIAAVEKWFQRQFAKSIQGISKEGFWREIIEGMGRVLGPMI